jgi:RNA polymerase sigma factor (sigma-70 family)
MSDRSEQTQRRDRLAKALGRVALGDEAALRQVYELTSAKLFGICLRILGDQGEAEDALQDVYVSVWRRSGSFDASRASPVTWLATLARNRAIDRLRVARRSRSAEPVEAALEIADSRPDALAVLAAGEDRQRLMACIGELEGRTEQAIRAAFFGGLTYSELAARMDVPLGTMKSWIRRGLMKLKDCLER